VLRQFFYNFGQQYRFPSDMAIQQSSLEMDLLKSTENENEPLRESPGLTNGNPTETTSIKMGKTDDKNTVLEFNRIIFSIIVPFVFIGSPFNYCFSKVDKNLPKFTTSYFMKVDCLLSSVQCCCFWIHFILFPFILFYFILILFILFHFILIHLILL